VTTSQGTFLAPGFRNSGGSFTATLPPALFEIPTLLTMTLVTPAPGGGLATWPVRVYDGLRPTELASISPSTTTVGASPALIIDGITLPDETSTGPIVRFVDQNNPARVFQVFASPNDNGQITLFSDDDWRLTINGGSSDLVSIPATFNVTIKSDVALESSPVVFTVQ